MQDPKQEELEAVLKEIQALLDDFHDLKARLDETKTQIEQCSQLQNEDSEGE